MTNKKRIKIRKTRKNNKKNIKFHKNENKNIVIGGYNDLTNDSYANEIMNQVKSERKNNFDKFNVNLGNFPLFKKTTDLVEGLTIKGIEHLAILLGVDLSNSQSINTKLEEIKLALIDPRNKEKVKEIISEAAKVGAVAIEAADPFIKPLLEKTTKIGQEALSKLGETAVKIGLNTAEEIPGVGILVGSVRSLSDAGEAFISSANAANEVITTTSDSINAATKNFERLMKEKMERLNRINDSVNKFKQPFNKENILQIPKTKLSGGKTHKYKKNTN
jgi:hypothetical protein